MNWVIFECLLQCYFLLLQTQFSIVTHNETFCYINYQTMYEVIERAVQKHMKILRKEKRKQNKRVNQTKKINRASMIL